MVGEVEHAGGQALAIKADAADAADAQRAVDEAVRVYKRINILVNNAGAIGREFTVRDMPIEEWDRLIGTDLRGVFLATKFVLPHMPTEPVGKIINISSELSRLGRAVAPDPAADRRAGRDRAGADRRPAASDRRARHLGRRCPGEVMQSSTVKAEVTVVEEDWPERALRRRRWLRARQALARIGDPGLHAVLHGVFHESARVEYT